MEAEMDLKGRNLLKELDFTKDEWLYLIDFAAKLRQDKREGKEVRKLEHKNIALIFEKASTRTRCAFEVASYDQGAHVTYLGPEGSQIGYKETMKDTARVLGRMYDGIEYRGFAQTTVETLGEFAGVPVWNGLTDEWHPTQMLADMLTMRDHKGTALDEVSYCYIGDARNNTANSLLVSGALVGMDVRICGPKALWPSDEVQSAAKRLAATSGARITVTETPEEGVKGVDFVYTDVWLSMGEPPEEWDERIDELIGECGVDEGERQQGREVHALLAGPAQPRHQDRQPALREAGSGGFGGDRGGLRVSRIGRLRRGREPASHDQSRHGRDARLSVSPTT
jgi:ornithine carbamoyltransferase